MQFHPLLKSLDGVQFTKFLLAFLNSRREEEVPEDLKNPNYKLFMRKPERQMNMEHFIYQFAKFYSFYQFNFWFFSLLFCLKPNS